jgi:hypothetical protein
VDARVERRRGGLHGDDVDAGAVAMAHPDEAAAELPRALADR